MSETHLCECPKCPYQGEKSDKCGCVAESEAEYTETELYKIAEEHAAAVHAYEAHVAYENEYHTTAPRPPKPDLSAIIQRVKEAKK